MNAIILDDRPFRLQLYPFTLTRSVLDIRIGILTLREKWEKLFEFNIQSPDTYEKNLARIPANIIPDKLLVEAIEKKRTDEFLNTNANATRIELPWNIFQWNAEYIISDYAGLTSGRVSQPVSSSNRVINPEKIFLEPGAKVEHAFLNAQNGPIYIGKNSEVMEGAMIRGPFALCEGSIVKMGARIYGSTVGPYSTVGGELKNSVLFGFSNKAHDGYLGDSVVGYWCNLGAGTSNSNLKNSADDIKVWHEASKKALSAGTKCGVLMGDYSRTAINTSINTGTVIGCCANLFGIGLTPAHIPSFSWGFNPSHQYELEKAISDIRNWKKLKNHDLNDAEINELKYIFAHS